MIRILLMTWIIVAGSFAQPPQPREGEAAGIIYTSVTATNPWSGTGETEGTASRWNLPIHYGMYGDGMHLDLSTDFFGWVAMLPLGDKDGTPNTPSFDEDVKRSYMDINVASIRISIDFFQMPLSILTGGQGGFGYLGVQSSEKSFSNYFESGSYASWGLNGGIAFDIGPQFFQTVFTYDWVYMGDIKGTRWGLEAEYFPFSAKSKLDFVRLKMFTKTTNEIPYLDKHGGSDTKYSDFQIGGGLVFNILI